MDRALFQEIMRLLEPLQRQILLVSSKGVLELVNDNRKMQNVQVSLLEGEPSDDAVEHMQPGGLTHVPLAGAEGVYLSIGGVRDDGVVFVLSNRENRPKGLQPGETALYSAVDKQATIIMKADGSIEVMSPTKVTVTAPEIEITGSEKVTVTAPQVTIKSDAISLGNAPTDSYLLADTFLQALKSWQEALDARLAGYATIADPTGSATATYTPLAEVAYQLMQAAISKAIKGQ